MTRPLVTVFTLSYNKSDYVGDAIESVLNQTFQDFEYVLIDNSTDEQTRAIIYQYGLMDKVTVEYKDFHDEQRKLFNIESIIKNVHFKKANGKYILFLADDDILRPTCLEEHIKDFQAHEKHRANYHTVECQFADGKDTWLKAEKTFNQSELPYCKTDGGAVMFETSLFDKLFFDTDLKNAAESDGLFLNQLVELTDIHPIDKVLSIKRITPISNYIKCEGNRWGK